LTLPTDARPTGAAEGEGPPAPPPSDSGAPPAPTGASPPRPPRRLRAFVIGLVLAAALAVFLFVGLGTGSNNGKGAGGVVPVGSAAPNFVLPSVTGGAPVDLHALGVDRHHPVVLNFFASWCVPCQQETPLLASTAQAERATGSVLQFVGVDVADRPANALPFIRQSGITYPVGQDADLKVSATRYGLFGMPQTFFIDESGVVVGHHQGALTKAVLDGWIHRLVGNH
jgi:cytochrome c biogenesis protein CcmG, thiol:disulfide interchange protein DsbE